MLQWVAILKPVIKMPRPKPPAPIKPRTIRLTDKQMMIFIQLGGPDWFRGLLEKKAPMPDKYYENKLKEKYAPDND
jgi:hypothetical protein